MNRNFSSTLAKRQHLDDNWQILILPIETSALILNLICFFAFISDKSKKRGQPNIIKYLKVYSINNVLLSLFYSISCANSVYIGLSINGPPAIVNFIRIYECKLFKYVSYSLCQFSHAINILMLLDRLSVFLFNKLFSCSKPYLKCSMMAVVCFMVSLPVLFQKKASDDGPAIGEQFCEPSEFGRTALGSAINLSSYVAREMLTVVVEIIAALVSAAYYKGYLKHPMQKYYYVINRGTPGGLNSKGKRLQLVTIHCAAISIFSHLVGYLFQLAVYVSLDSDVSTATSNLIRLTICAGQITGKSLLCAYALFKIKMI